MLWRKKEREDDIPWYRQHGYKGNLTEEEKRELDSLRWLAQQPGGEHPATEFSDLPEDVQSYISKLEVELHEERGTVIFGRAFLMSVVGAIFVAGYFGWNIPVNPDSILSLLGGLFLLIAPWFVYAREERKLRRDVGMGSTESIRSEWELNHIVSKKRVLMLWHMFTLRKSHPDRQYSQAGSLRLRLEHCP